MGEFKNGKTFTGAQNNQGPKYSGAPYNFIKLPEHVYCRYDDISQLPEHSEISDELLSGEIEYTITPETEIFIGDHTGNEFYRNTAGKLAVPGSSFRGLVRGNVQILGRGSIGDDVDDFRLMYRKLAATDDLGKHYKTILGVKTKTNENADGKKTSVSICENVKAGYLQKHGSGYVIYSTIDSVKDSDNRNYFYLRSDRLSKICPEGIKYESGERIVTDVQNPSYIPFSVKVSYNTDRNRVSAIGAPDKFSQNGYLVGSGPMNGKKAIYIIPEINREISLNISDDAVTSFKRDYEMKKKLLGATVKGISAEKKQQFKEYFALPEGNAIKPVFYIEYDGTTYFGFTPYLRIFYKYTISDGLPEDHKPTVEGQQPKWDYARAVFGFSKGNVSFKSRVFFTDAEYEGKEEFVERLLVLGEPHPSSYYDYLEPKDKKASTYNDEEFTIRGYKQYWLRDKVDPVSVNKACDPEKMKKNVASELKPLAAGNGKFRGVIRFKNLYPDELGILLYAVSIGDSYSYNIGKGKPYGLGRIKTEVTSLRTFENSKLYSSDTLCFDPFKEYSKEEIIKFTEEFRNLISETVSGKEEKKRFEKTERDFQLMKNTSKLPPVEKIRYMDINNREYQNRGDNSVLKTPAQVINGDNNNNNNGGPAAGRSDKPDKPRNNNIFGNGIVMKKGR